VTARPEQAGRARFDIAVLVRTHRAQLEAEHPLTREQKRVLTDIAQCRTAALGGHLDRCDSCGYEHPSYNSCRNRHCPKCQALAAEAWIEQRRQHLLDVGHFHVVFTLPAQLRPLAKHDPHVVYDALLWASARTLLEFGEQRLDATLGATLVLHTWTRDLRFHPHVHAIVTDGGLSRDGERFVRGPDRRFLFPVKAMSKVFCGKLLAALSLAYNDGLFADFDDFRDPAAFPRLVARLAKLRWHVYAKAPFKKSKHVLAYLGRYTHRVGIANSRLLDVTDAHVVFRTKGDATETLAPVEFLWRFVQHVLPDGFHKIRHFGLYASAAHQRLALARERLGMPTPAPLPRRAWEQQFLAITGRDVCSCPVCHALLLRWPLPHPARGPPDPGDG
jgi:predicted Zn-ribbon and HTH transcriptional regulator